MAASRTDPSAVDGLRARRRSHSSRARIAFEILVAYAQSHRALRRAPISTVVAGLRSRSSNTPASIRDPLDEACSLGWAVARMLAYFPGDTRCLVRSLVLTRLLAKRGIQAKLVIGASPSPEFLAHAWVEHEGHPVLDPGDESFGRLVEL
jgi:hypothetical protein